ncbi:hypothetical protein U14_02851 [Candidatus Moduliflexus flocculans]|uniref:Ig-like domain-containing protein n=1 Tax=Candidatus Moduliflexus flocculans TaxID=1499966 RepID=A0A081BMJ0_9BACT|nr:hypothetical protein U14_02851 [Candidatus Moduliflexus flocculans]
MRRANRLALLLVVLFVFTFFTGCELLEPFFGGLFNESPTVSLSYSPESPIINQVITLTATAVDPDNDTLTYTWYKDDVEQTEATSSQVTWTPSASGTYTLKVVVSDGKETAEDSVSIIVAGTFRVLNSSSFSIYYLYSQEYGYETWSSDLLGSYYISSGGSIDIDMDPGYYYFKAYDQNSYYVWSSNLIYISGDPTYTWTLTD